MKELDLRQVENVAGGNAVAYGTGGALAGGSFGGSLGTMGAIAAGIEGASWGRWGGLGGAALGFAAGVAYYYYTM